MIFFQFMLDRLGFKPNAVAVVSRFGEEDAETFGAEILDVMPEASLRFAPSFSQVARGVDLVFVCLSRDEYASASMRVCILWKALSLGAKSVVCFARETREYEIVKGWPFARKALDFCAEFLVGVWLRRRR